MSLRAGSIAARARGRVVGSDAFTRTHRLAGDDRAKLSPGESVRGTSAQGGFRYLEQRGTQPGAGLVRQRGGHAEGHHSYPERWDLLVWRNAVAGAYGHAHQRVQLGHHRRGCRAERSGNDPNRIAGESQAHVTVEKSSRQFGASPTCFFLCMTDHPGADESRFTMRRHSFTSDSARRALGVAGIVGFVALALCSDTNMLAKFHIMNTAKAEGSLIGTFRPRKLAADATPPRGSHSLLGDEGAMPDLDGAIGWLNSAPLSSKSLRGKVVLVDFWTYTCINSLRPLPYVKSWAAKYKDAGLVVIGAHTPEFSFEKEGPNVEKMVHELKVTYPVAIDSNYRIWQRFNNQAWPAQFLVDAKGRIRYHHFGEDDYREIEGVIQDLLKENGATGLASETTSVPGIGIEAAPDWADERSPETYIGYRQAQNFASPEKVHNDSIQIFSAPGKLSLNHWGLSGSWNINSE